jgi:hypothetical protein
MRRWFKRIWYNVHKDRLHHYHKCPCSLYDRRFTVIDNICGKKIWEGNIKYCPICGERLDGTK